MNKTEKIICALLGAVLVLYFVAEMRKPKQQAPQRPAAVQTAKALIFLI